MPWFYLVGTPIGNLDYVSARCLRVLRSSKLVAAEDTRRIRKLLNRFGIAVKTISFREQNRARLIPRLIGEILGGAAVALVSDAGMPTVSDPGADLVRACRENGLSVFVVPGPSAVTAAVALSGFPADRFSFIGFPPPRRAARLELFKSVREREEVIVLFEAPHRILATLADLEEIMGNRQASLAREMTKVHEEVLLGRISELRRTLEERERILGEFTIVLAGAEVLERRQVGEEEVKRRYFTLLAEGLDPKEAIALVATASGRSKRELYNLLRRKQPKEGK